MNKFNLVGYAEWLERLSDQLDEPLCDGHYKTGDKLIKDFLFASDQNNPLRCILNMILLSLFRIENKLGIDKEKTHGI